MNNPIKNNILLISTVFLAVFLLADDVLAHPGNTDSSGCHTCRTNCPSWGLSMGEYHCHNAKALPQPKEPIKSTFGANGTGSVSPAPEYKNNLSSAPSASVTKPISADTSSGDKSDWLGWVALLGTGGGIGYWASKRKNS